MIQYSIWWSSNSFFCHNTKLKGCHVEGACEDRLYMTSPNWSHWMNITRHSFLPARLPLLWLQQASLETLQFSTLTHYMLKHWYNWYLRTVPTATEPCRYCTCRINATYMHRWMLASGWNVNEIIFQAGLEAQRHLYHENIDKLD